MQRKPKWIEIKGECEDCHREGKHFCTGPKPQKSVAETVSSALKDLLPDFIKTVREEAKAEDSTIQEKRAIDKPEDLSNNNKKEMQEKPMQTISEELPPQTKQHKPATKPWESGENPWKRDTLRLQKTRPGFRPRWVDPRNFERNLEDGWTFAERKDYGDVYEKITGEEKQLDSRIRRRGMILMEIPENLAKKREDYYANRADRLEKSIKERYSKDAKDLGVETYNPIRR